MAVPYLLALGVLPLITIPWWLAVLVAFLLLAAAREALRRHAWLTAPDALVSVTWLPSGAWVVATRAGDRLSARLTAPPFVLTVLVIIELRLETGRRASVILVPGMAPAASLRRLRIRLRHLNSRKDDPRQAI
jgi:hypothetical protein